MIAVPLLASSSTMTSKSKAVIDQLATQLQTWWSGQLMRFPCKTSVRQKHFSWAQFFSLFPGGFPHQDSSEILWSNQWSDRDDEKCSWKKDSTCQKVSKSIKGQKFLQEVSWGWGVGLVVGTFDFCLRGLALSSCSNRFFSSLVVYS